MPASLPTRKIGTHDVTALGYGAMGIAAFYGQIPGDEERLKVCFAFEACPIDTAHARSQFLDTLYESGCTFWDSADVYADSEELIGKWYVRPLPHAAPVCLHFMAFARFAKTGKRKDIFLATKFGINFGNGRGTDGSPAYMREQVEKSLKRLQTGAYTWFYRVLLTNFHADHIDLYYLHRPDKTIPIEETVTAMAELVKYAAFALRLICLADEFSREGKVTYLGLSECSSGTLRRAHAIHPIAAVQVEYSPFALDIEDPKIGLLATARELGVKIVAYSPLGRGMLTGRYRKPDDLDEGDRRRNFPRFSADNFPRINALVDGLRDIGKREGGTASQVTLAWILAQGEDFIPIPGTKSVKVCCSTCRKERKPDVLQYLEENLGALKLNLTDAELAAVRKQAEEADIAAAGDRYPPEMAAHLYLDTPEWKKA
jgi:aryl-alcohol dehydrogenase-like predicted oxidoreductase